MNKQITISGFILLTTLIITYMGFFDKIFGKKPTNQSNIELPESPEYKERWDFYLTNVDDKIGSIVLDMGLHNIAPVKGITNLAWISVKMNSPRENGLISRDESDILGEIEEKLAAKIKSYADSYYAGRLSTGGFVDLYFYVSDTTFFEKAFSEVMVKYPKYEFKNGCKEDKDWSDYLNFLYPVPEQIQMMENSKVVNQLEQQGDKLTKAREVDHWIYFKTKIDRTNFQKKIVDDGFKVVKTDFNKSLGAFPYSLHIQRVDKVDINSVDDYAIKLWRLAGEFNGDYDGWETQIIRE